MLSTNGTDVNYRIDTGAEVNVMPLSIYHDLHEKPLLDNTNVTLTAYNGSSIPVRGRCITTIERYGKSVPILFIIADTSSPPVIGAKASEHLNLIKRIMTVNSENSEFISEFNDCFGELGTLPRTHDIHIDKNVPPVIHAARRIPVALRDRLLTELDRMLKLGVIERVSEPTL